uniref:Uncharacterized protein n=1 Tax=Tanacetum cinerariifolium TaxID=118510 RepID=A0A699GJN5_TANCI|nr:hypothetical protein [Tanacetum cinerariifolium]
MESIKKSIKEKSQHKREYDTRVNERQMQSKEGKVDSSKAFDASLVITECSGTKSDKHDTSSMSGNDADTEDANIRPLNDQAPLAEVQLTAQHNVLANEQNHSMQSEPIYDTHLLEKVDRNTTPDSTNMCHRGGEIDQNAKKLNSHIKVQSPKTRNNIKPVEKIYNVIKPKRWISKGYMISLNKSSTVHKKPNTPRSCLRWKPTDRIFKTAGLRWIPTGKMFTDSTTMLDNVPPDGSNKDITNPYECEQTFNVSTGPGLQSMTHATSNSGLVSNLILQQPCNTPPGDDWDGLFQAMFDEYSNRSTIAVSLVSVANAPRAVDLADSPVSMSIDQDAPSTSIPSTQDQEHSLIISQGFEESPKTSYFHDDLLHESLHEDSTY